MNKKVVLFVTTLLCIVCTAIVLNHVRENRRLGPPGVLTSPTQDPNRLKVDLPERVLNYSSEWVETEKLVLDFLPKDTSFGQRRYTAPDGFQTLINVVLMGTDRTSHHRPEFCLTGSGWDIDSSGSQTTSIPMERPRAYDLPVMKLVTTKQIMQNGQPVVGRGIYVYWYVADHAYTASHNQKVWLMAKEILRTGVLPRWAYITCFSVCAPGQEEATYERMKKFIAAAVPEFQLVPKVEQTLAVRQ